MTKSKSKIKYTYDYPENRKLAKGLILGDYAAIAAQVGVSKSYVAMIFRGERKLTEEVRQLSKKLSVINKKRAQILNRI